MWTVTASVRRTAVAVYGRSYGRRSLGLWNLVFRRNWSSVFTACNNVRPYVTVSDAWQAIPWITGVTQYLLCGAAPSSPHTPNVRSSPHVDDGISTEGRFWTEQTLTRSCCRCIISCLLTAHACVCERPRQSEQEAGACRGRSEEGLIENTRWAQWSVCRAIRCAIILMQIICTDNSAAGGRER